MSFSERQCGCWMGKVVTGTPGHPLATYIIKILLTECILIYRWIINHNLATYKNLFDLAWLVWVLEKETNFCLQVLKPLGPYRRVFTVFVLRKFCSKKLLGSGLQTRNFGAPGLQGPPFPPFKTLITKTPRCYNSKQFIDSWASRFCEAIYSIVKTST